MEERKRLLSIRDLDVKFKVRGRTLTAIRNVSLDIYENETIAIVGESGCGKSVLTKTFAGTLDNNGYIDHGDIIFYDEGLNDLSFPVNPAVRRFVSMEASKLDRYAGVKGTVTDAVKARNEVFAKEIWMSVNRYPAVRRPILIRKVEKAFRMAYANGSDLMTKRSCGRSSRQLFSA